VRRADLTDLRAEIRDAYSSVGNLVHAMNAPGAMRCDNADDVARCLLQVLSDLRAIEMQTNALEHSEEVQP
jgi:hypothetical protein